MSDSSPPGDPAFMNPNDILFSLPTLCDPAPATLNTPPPGNALRLHEDDWRQIEFVAKQNADYLQDEIEKLMASTREHRRGQGWSQIYMRREHPVTFASLGLTDISADALAETPLALGGATVAGGFGLSDGSGWALYGQRTPDDHALHLGVAMGEAPLAEPFARLLSGFANATGLLLVDWYAPVIVDTASPEGVLEWAQRCAG